MRFIILSSLWLNLVQIYLIFVEIDPRHPQSCLFLWQILVELRKFWTRTLWLLTSAPGQASSTDRLEAQYLQPATKKKRASLIKLQSTIQETPVGSSTCFFNIAYHTTNIMVIQSWAYYTTYEILEKNGEGSNHCPKLGRALVARGKSGLRPLHWRAPVGEHHYDRALRSLEVRETRLLEYVSPRMHTSPQIL